MQAIIIRPTTTKRTHKEQSDRQEGVKPPPATLPFQYIASKKKKKGTTANKKYEAHKSMIKVSNKTRNCRAAHTKRTSRARKNKPVSPSARALRS